MTGPIRVTAEDRDSGESSTAEVMDNYVLVTAGRCHVSHINRHANGTHVVTIKGATGQPAVDVPAEPASTEPGANLTTSLHSVRWRLESGGGLDVHFLCSAPEGARCRMWCAEGCEERCTGGPSGEDHRQADYGSCLLVSWLNSQADDIAEVFDGPETVPVRDGAVKISWDGNLESYVWVYADQTGSVRS